MAAIETQALSKTFYPRSGPRRRAGVEAVRDITFAVEHAERLAYIGPNGAGKSTSIKMLTGILHPTRGDAQVLGFTPWTDRRRLVQHIGALFGQRSQLWFQLTPRRTLNLLAAIHRLDDREKRSRIAELAELLDASELLDTPAKDLSLGQRMRCELAASMLHAPRVLFLDEPSIGLDLVAKQRLREMIIRLNSEQGTTVFLTSHDVADIEHVARRVIVINHGTIIYDGSVSEMRRSFLKTKLLEVRFENEPGPVEIQAVEILKHSGLGYKLEVDTERRDIRSVLDDLLDRYEVADISVLDPPLEEIIGRIYETPHP